MSNSFSVFEKQCSATYLRPDTDNSQISEWLKTRSSFW